MPSYEISMILKCLERPQLVQAVKRTSDYILKNGGYIRTYENLGERKLPFIMFRHRGKFLQGNYFLINFDGPVEALKPIKDFMTRDLDIIRPRVLRKEEEVGRPCHDGTCDFGELDEEKRRRLRINLKNYIEKL